jgi:hypothetical protein
MCKNWVALIILRRIASNIFIARVGRGAGGGIDYRDVTGRCSARLVNELRFRLICDSGAIPTRADELLQRV